MLPELLWMGGICAVGAADVPGGISDSEIRDVITRVAKHQIPALTEGDYAAVNSVDEVKAAKAPEGIA